MKIRFLRAWRWYKKDQTLEVADSVGKLWELMGHAVRAEPQDARQPAAAAIQTAETAEDRALPEAAMAIPPLRRRRVMTHVPQPEQTD